MKNCIATFLSIFFVLSFFINAQVKTIRDPKPSVDESVCPSKNLILIKEIISDDINADDFMVRPYEIAVDKKGNIFTFDAKIRKIFKFDNQFRFIKVFGNEGEGPGEYRKTRNPLYLQIKDEVFLFLVDIVEKNFLKYDLNGNFLEEIDIPIKTFDTGTPVFDQEGNAYVIDTDKNGISRFGENGQRLDTFLSFKDYEYSVELEIKPSHYSFWVTPGAFNTYFSVFNDNSLFIYLFGPSKFFIFKDGKLEKNVFIYPKESLLDYREKIKSRGDSFFFLFNSCIFDQDTWQSFYLVQARAKEILQIDLNGKLIKKLKYDTPVLFRVKKNGYFYGSFNESIFIFKEV